MKDVYLAKFRGTLYAGDNQPKPQETLLQQLKDYPENPITEEQFEHIDIEPTFVLVDAKVDKLKQEDRLFVEKTDDGERREVMKDVEFYMIIKIPISFNLDTTEAKEIFQTVEATGLGRYSSVEIVEFKHIGTHIDMYR